MSTNGNGKNGKRKPANGLLRKPPELKVQPHGGALQVGNPGNNGGPGRPSKYVRDRAAWSWEQRIPRLEKIADGKLSEGSIADSLAAMRELRAVGFAERVEHSGAVSLTPEEREERVADLLNTVKKRLVGNGNGHR